MENRPSFPNTPFNQNNSPNNSQGAPQLDSQLFTHQPYSFNLQYPFGSFSSQLFGDQSQFTSRQPCQTNHLKRSAVGKTNKSQRQQKERNPNWTKAEDVALCKAWLQVSEDAITGSDQPRQRLWDRSLYGFNKLLGCESERVSSALMNRWSVLQGHLNKYSGFMQMVKRNPTSGHNINDSIVAVDKLYHDDQGHEFKWHACWLILKDSAIYSRLFELVFDVFGKFHVDLHRKSLMSLMI